MKSVPPPAAPKLTALLNANGLHDVGAGVITGLVALCYGVGYGSMIFSGSLSSFAAAGMPVALVSCIVIAFVIALRGSLPFTIGGPDSNPTAILTGITAGVAGAVRAHGGSVSTVLSTVLMVIALSTLVTGVLQYVVGATKRSAVIQFLPFPVMGGFLGGAGYLMAGGAFRMLTGESLHWSTLPALGGVPWIEWLPALVTCGVLYLCSQRMKVAALPLGLGAGALVFFVGLHLKGTSIGTAHQMGLMFQAAPLSMLSLPERMSLAAIDWSAILSELPGIAVVAVVSSITMLLNISSLSVAEGVDVDLDRELSVAGQANIATALCGGMIGYQSLSRTMLNREAGARGRLSALVCALTCLVVVACMPELISRLPRPILVGLQLYLAVKLLQEWLIAAYPRLGFSEYLLIPLIVVVIAVEGVALGVGFGIVAACILFALSYSRISIVRSEFDGGSRHSNVVRSIEECKLLKEHARQVVGVCLQGFLFFGTASTMLQHLRKRFDRSPGLARLPRFVVVDFTRVDGVDASTSLTFHKLRQFCSSRSLTLVLAALPSGVEETLTRVDRGVSTAIRHFEDLDSGLEWIEEELLSAVRERSMAGEQSLRSELAPYFSEAAFDRLEAYLESQELQVGETLFRQGDPGDGVYLVEQGRVTVSLPFSDRRRLRLRSYGIGTIVGEMSLYTQQPRSADVSADVPTRVRRLSLDGLRRLEAEAPGPAREFHRFVVRVLAARLETANEALHTLH